MIDGAELRRLKTVGDLVPHFIESRVAKNLRPATMTNWHVWARWMQREWRDKLVRRVTDGQIVALAAKKSRNHALLTQAFFRWLREVKVLKLTFHVGKVPSAALTDERSISYWTPDEAVRFLAAVREEYRAGCVLGLYAGLRPYEMCRIEWRDVQVSERRIRISARVSKIRRARMIEGIPAIIWTLLKPLAKAEGRVMPGSDDVIAVYRYVHERARAGKAAGVQLHHDIFRHTFATYYAAWTGHAAMCSRILGHYKIRTLAAHYDGVATKAEAKEYFRASYRARRAAG
ncbi:tyrosine-type recombinase/integrase [Verrucomicrobium spinosum]|uniref:tyrosine-type recombinase/integrase n=1 Tax=Verrucomicrobium spinosum TaxID=2736 RepID=UPI00017463AA|nr:tyrosine-type recombinase/integrase [Verrucomicrobium spinosum]